MVGKNIRRLRKERGYSQEQLARKLNVTQGVVSHWEIGSHLPGTAQMIQMAQIFGVPLDSLTDDSPQRELDSVRVLRNAIPIIGSIACGERITPDTTPEEYADLPEGIHADFALRCKGDSMLPTLRDGDLVLIRSQPEVENGQIAAVNIDGETTLKHIYKQQDGLALVAENPAFAPVYVPTNADIVIHGLAVGYVRIFE